MSVKKGPRVRRLTPAMSSASAAASAAPAAMPIEAGMPSDCASSGGA
jgi:hypothetical protein